MSKKIRTKQKKVFSAVVAKPDRKAITELYKLEFIESLKTKGLYESFIKEFDRDMKKKEEEWNKKKKKVVVVNTKSRYYLTITYTFYIIYYSVDPVYKTPVETGKLDIEVTTKNISNDIIQKLVEDHLHKQDNEYSEYVLISIKAFNYIKHDKVVKNANYNAKQEYMFACEPLRFSWVPDIQFENNNRCVYNAIKHLADENYPRSSKIDLNYLNSFKNVRIVIQ
jgi:hypothetical protein